MSSLKFLCLLLISIAYSFSVEGNSDAVAPGGVSSPKYSSFLNALRSKRSPEPEPHRRRHKLYLGSVYVNEPYAAVPVIATVPRVTKIKVYQPVIAQPIYRPVVAQPVYQPVVSKGCKICGGGGGALYGGGGSQASSHAASQASSHAGGHAGSHASSQASSSSFSAGLNFPFGNLGFSSSAAQSSAHAGSSAYV